MSAPLLASVQSWAQKPKRHFFHGEWRDGGTQVFKSINPCNGTELAQFPIAESGVIHAAVASAQECFQTGSWRQLSGREKAKLLRRIGDVTRAHLDELATIEALDNGKLYSEALDDAPDCADIFDYYAGWTDKITGETVPVDSQSLNYTLREPLGVCALIVPWNFPLLLAMWKIAPALATGNTVVIKPSEHTSLSLIRWFELIHQEVKLPVGLLNLVLGDGTTGDLLTKHPGVQKISFTGSTRVGREIIRSTAGAGLKSLSLELGGKSPNIFFDDTPDLTRAIERSFQQHFSQKGEKCSEPTRFIIHRSIHDQVVSELVKKANAVVCGDSFDPRSQQGAQNNRAHYEKILDYIRIGMAEGAELRAGGKRCERAENASGLFIRPTIFTGVTSTMRIWNEEIFGPVLAITAFDTEEEAIELANQTDYGLAAGLWTKDISRAHRVAARLNAGMIFINKYGRYDFASPFGGFKQSGWGKEMGKDSIEQYTKLKSVWVTL